MNINIIVIIILVVILIFCLSFNSMLNLKINNLSRRVELNSIHTRRNLCELTETLNQSFQYLDDCNVLLKKLMNDTIKTLKNILSNIEIDKNSMLNMLKNKLDIDNENYDLNELYNYIDKLNIKYKSIELTDTILYDNITRLNKIVSLLLLNNNINLLKDDYNSLKITNYELVNTKGDINTPSILDTRRITINNSIFYMPNNNMYNTFDILYIDVLSKSIINKARTSMKEDLNVIENQTIIFILYESQWVYIKTLNQ